MPVKLATAIVLILIMCGNSFAATPASAATPQVETRQDPAQKEMQERMSKAANKKRQQDIRDDTDKLFQLATELKAAVDKTNENLLSLDVSPQSRGSGEAGEKSERENERVCGITKQTGAAHSGSSFPALISEQ